MVVPRSNQLDALRAAMAMASKVQRNRGLTKRARERSGSLSVGGSFPSFSALDFLGFFSGVHLFTGASKWHAT